VPDVKDLVMWVGAKPYPAWQVFADEAARLGCCKRIRNPPKDVTPGLSRVFLIHGERVTSQEKIKRHIFRKSGGKCYFCRLTREEHSQTLKPCVERVVTRTGKPLAYIYGFFVIGKVRYVIDDPEKADKFREEFKKLNPEILGSQEAGALEVRGCGTLVSGGIYFVSSGDMDALAKAAEPLADKVEFRGPLAVLKDPIPWAGPAFVGYRYFDANTFGFAYLQEPVRVEKAVSVQGSLPVS
jgi:hypothetical protein